MVTFFVDVMGGDYAPDEIVRGVEKYILETKETDFSIKLFAVEDAIKKYKDLLKEKSNVEWVVADSFIRMEDEPVRTLQQNNKTTIELALRSSVGVRESVVISAGSTGGFVASSVLTLGLIEGVRRPIIITSIPTLNGATTLLDLGANMEPRLIDYLIYANIGKIYAQSILGKQEPKIGLLNVGEEKGKGPKLIQDAYNLLKNEEKNFIGNVEGNEIFKGIADVIVCDGFVGNIMLKAMEGVFEIIKSKLLERFESVLKSNGASDIYERCQEAMRLFDYKEYGGALLLGVKGYCIVCHGRSKREAIANALKKGYKYAKSGVLEKLEEYFHTNQKIKSSLS
jgi:glycerol-3-phosphate acyltransferase PlsX